MNNLPIRGCSHSSGFKTYWRHSRRSVGAAGTKRRLKVEDHMYKVVLLRPILETNTTPFSLLSPLVCASKAHLKIARQHFCSVLLRRFFWVYSTMLQFAGILFCVFFFLSPSPFAALSWSVRGYSTSSVVCAKLWWSIKSSQTKSFPPGSWIMHQHHLPSSGRKTSKMSNFSSHSESQTEREMCYFDCRAGAKHLLHQ